MTKYFGHSFLLAGLILSGCLSFFCHSAKAGGCPIVDRYPHTSSHLLSNGKHVNLPTKSDDFDVVAIIATMDYQKTLDLVRSQKAHGYPLMAGKKALGKGSSALS